MENIVDRGRDFTIVETFDFTLGRDGTPPESFLVGLTRPDCGSWLKGLLVVGDLGTPETRLDMEDLAEMLVVRGRTSP